MSRVKSASNSAILGPFTVRVKVGRRTVALRLTPDPEDGGFVVSSPTLRGLNSQGDTIDEAVANGSEAALALLTEPRSARHA